MKKFLAILCAIALVCAMATVVAADEVVIASDLQHAAGWQQTEMKTTLWGGTIDSGFIVEGGVLQIHITANLSDLWQVRLCLNGKQWTELDWHVDPTQVTNACGTIVDNGDGTAVVSFAYADIVAIYGTSDFAGTLGAITIATNGASAVTVNKVCYVTNATTDDNDENDDETDAATILNMGDNYVVAILDYLPEYQAGDEVTITVDMESNAYFNGCIGANVNGSWASNNYESAEGNKVVASWTCVPECDFQVQVWWTNDGSTGVKINSITITKVEKETEATTTPTEAPTTAPTEAPTTAPTEAPTTAPTVDPGDENQKTGDPIAMVIALMAASAMGITVLGKKKF